MFCYHVKKYIFHGIWEKYHDEWWIYPTNHQIKLLGVTAVMAFHIHTGFRTSKRCQFERFLQRRFQVSFCCGLNPNARITVRNILWTFLRHFKTIFRKISNITTFIENLKCWKNNLKCLPFASSIYL